MAIIELSEKIAQARLASGERAESIANKLDISKSLIYNWEKLASKPSETYLKKWFAWIKLYGFDLTDYLDLSNFNERYLYLKYKKNMNNSDVGRLTGISSSTMNGFDKNAKPSRKFTEYLCNVLSTSQDFINGNLSGIQTTQPAIQSEAPYGLVDMSFTHSLDDESPENMDISIFNFDSDSSIRVIFDNEGESMFVAKDIAETLGYVDTINAIKQHCDDEVVKYHPLPTAGGMQNFRVINEEDVYALILGSKLESAKKFKKWVLGVVLPTIRKTGKFEVQPTSAVLSHLDPRVLSLFDAEYAFAKKFSDDKVSKLHANDAVKEKFNIDLMAIVHGSMNKQSNLPAA